MVQNSEWGPPLWRILHTIAERLGNQAIRILAADEARLWSNLLAQTQLVLPCKVCRKHYKEWRDKKAIPNTQGLQLREDSRRWLWELHETVNKGKGVTSDIELEKLPELYGKRDPQELQADIQIFYDLLSRAMQAGQQEGEPVRAWKSTFTLLRKIIGV